MKPTPRTVPKWLFISACVLFVVPMLISMVLNTLAAVIALVSQSVATNVTRILPFIAVRLRGDHKKARFRDPSAADLVAYLFNITDDREWVAEERKWAWENPEDVEHNFWGNGSFHTALRGVYTPSVKE